MTWSSRLLNFSAIDCRYPLPVAEHSSVSWPTLTYHPGTAANYLTTRSSARLNVLAMVPHSAGPRRT